MTWNCASHPSWSQAATTTRTFAGDKKDGESILGTYEKKAVANTVRLGYVALNTLVFFTGTDIFWWGVPAVLAAHVTALVAVARGVQKNLGRLDMDARDAAEASIGG